MRRLIGIILLTVMAEVLFIPLPAMADSADADSITIKKEERRIWEGRIRKAIKRERTSSQNRVPATRPHTKSRVIQLRQEPTKSEVIAAFVMCREAKWAGLDCSTARKKKAEPTKKKPQINLSAVARTLIVRLQLPDPTPQIGPDPSVNEWKMAAVGYPLWLWTGGPRTVTSRVRAYGVTFTLRATWLSTDFDMGDGHRVTCTSTRVYTKQVRAGAKSPDCGYTYLTSSLPKGNYTVTATTNWRISWSALGQSGSLPGSYSGTRSLPVGELNALVVK